MKCLRTPIFVTLSSLMLLPILSCSTLKTPQPGFISTDTECLVFGRLRLIFNGEDLRVYTEPSKENNTYVYFKKKHLSVEKKLRREDGYFAVVLPPEKYEISSIARKHFKDYRVPGWGSWTPSNSKICISFEVKANSATYIGTLTVAFKTKQQRVYKTRHWRTTHGVGHYKDHMWSGWETKTVIVPEKWHIVEEFSDAKTLFRSLYPDHDDPIERIAVVKQFGKK